MNFTDLRQSPEYGEYMEKIGWKVEKINNCQVFIRKLSLLGSIIKIQRPQRIPFKKIDQLAKKHRAFAIYLEPSIINHKSYIINHKYRPSRSAFLSTKTIHLDLTYSEEKILSQMKKDARYAIRKAQKNKLSAIGGSAPGGQLIKLSLKDFYKFWRRNKGRHWIPPFSWILALKNSFNKDFFQLVSYNDTYYHLPLAGTILLRHDKVMYYYYAFSSKEGKKLFAPYFLVWEAIKLARKQGCQIFDFEGIYDERFPQKSWKGFTHFKKSFGGKEIEYPGSFIKYRLPL